MDRSDVHGKGQSPETAKLGEVKDQGHRGQHPT